ncbi:Uncharacterized protein FKW44_018452 [Caligus rogercresseyi]|uniref:Uncharacterized protein n=1 Tax=Caligus rogercresseyi TaxID=217165 RepID=A0A7T8JWP3_CALRO|nr:Uncharacterized protein FKW44_018452 [Caligus rogercresseyi]
MVRSRVGDPRSRSYPLLGVTTIAIYIRRINDSARRDQEILVSTRRISISAATYAFDWMGSPINGILYFPERYRPVLASCYRNAAGAIIVFDLTNPTSFLNLKQWLEEISEFAEGSLPKILVGNKADLSERRSFAENTQMTYIETSALESTNVKQAFTSLIQSQKKS